MPAQDVNPVRGEAALGEHMLKADFNRFCVLEAALGMGTAAILKAMETGLSFTQLRAVVRAFLVGDFTDEQAGEIIGQEGVTETLLAVTAATAGFFAPKKDKSARPLKAA